MRLTGRLPLRFSLRTLCILPVLLALGLGWITWPAETARTFVALINAERRDAAAAMLGPEVDRAVLPFLRHDLTGWQEHRSERRQVKSRPRTWADLAAGRQRFQIDCYHFWVERGRVVHVRWVFSCGVEYWNGRLAHERVAGWRQSAVRRLRRGLLTGPLGQERPPRHLAGSSLAGYTQVYDANWLTSKEQFWGQSYIRH